MQHRERVRSRLYSFEAQDRLKKYMKALGFAVRVCDDALIFERTHPIGFLPGAPPRTWEAKLVALIESTDFGSDTKMEWIVNTEGRLFTPWDLHYIRNEIKGSVRAVAGTRINIRTLDKCHVKAALRSAAIYTSAFITIALASAMLVGGDIDLPVWLTATAVVAVLLAIVQAKKPKPVTWSARSFQS